MASEAPVEMVHLGREYVMRQNGTVTRVKAVDDINLNLGSGELFGLLGVNGAGKTTMIKMLSTLLTPSTGDALICGQSVRRRPDLVRARIGCQLPGERALYWKLTARENLEFFGAMYGLPRQAARKRAVEVLTLVGLIDRADERIEKYSTGMRQRIGLARTIMHQPPVVLLDEPTTGLDVHSARALRTLIRDLASSGRTILLTTHNLAEAEELCDRVGIIDAGRLVALDSPANLRRISGAVDCLILTVPAQEDLPPPTGESIVALLQQSVAALRFTLSAGTPAIRVKPIVSSGAADGQWRIAITGPGIADQAAECLVALRAAGFAVCGLEVTRPTLEDVFVELTGGDTAAAGASAVVAGDGDA